MAVYASNAAFWNSAQHCTGLTAEILFCSPSLAHHVITISVLPPLRRITSPPNRPFYLRRHICASYIKYCISLFTFGILHHNKVKCQIVILRLIVTRLFAVAHAFRLLTPVPAMIIAVALYKYRFTFDSGISSLFHSTSSFISEMINVQLFLDLISDFHIFIWSKYLLFQTKYWL